MIPKWYRSKGNREVRDNSQANGARESRDSATVEEKNDKRTSEASQHRKVSSNDDNAVLCFCCLSYKNRVEDEIAKTKSKAAFFPSFDLKEKLTMLNQKDNIRHTKEENYELYAHKKVSRS